MIDDNYHEKKVKKILMETNLRAWEIDPGIHPQDATRFYEGVLVKGDNECWPWRRCCHPHGYGLMQINGRAWYSHKISWCIANDVSSVPAGHRLTILCGNKKCCNPAHITLGRIKFIDKKRVKIPDASSNPSSINP